MYESEHGSLKEVCRHARAYMHAHTHSVSKKFAATFMRIRLQLIISKGDFLPIVF